MQLNKRSLRSLYASLKVYKLEIGQGQEMEKHFKSLSLPALDEEIEKK